MGDFQPRKPDAIRAVVSATNPAAIMLTVHRLRQPVEVVVHPLRHVGGDRIGGLSQESGARDTCPLPCSFPAGGVSGWRRSRLTRGPTVCQRLPCRETQ